MLSLRYLVSVSENKYINFNRSLLFYASVLGMRASCILLNAIVLNAILTPVAAGRGRQEANNRMLKAAEKTIQMVFPRDFDERETDWRTVAIDSEILAQDTSTDYLSTQLAKAQDNEDIMIYENLFYGKANGLIIESGAMDGKMLSLSWFFEKYANWTTINIEGDPSNYRFLKENRPDSLNIFTPLCSHPQNLHYTDGLGNMNMRGYIEFMDPGFIEKYFRQIVLNKTVMSDLAVMRCSTMKGLLRTLAVKHVDVWILDVEGAELSVLQGTDFHEVQFEAIVMECDGINPEKDKEKKKYLRYYGFQCDQIQRNCFCSHKSFVASSKQIKSFPKQKHWDGSKWIL